jgi:hypothetical protein
LTGRHRRRETRIRGAEDDFEVEDAVDYEMDATGEDDEDEGDLRDYDTEYDMPMGDYTVQESETFISTEGVEEERVVDYKIDEDEFHKLCLYDCDFFIRKVPDQDNDVFDFREVFSIAGVLGFRCGVAFLKYSYSVSLNVSLILSLVKCADVCHCSRYRHIRNSKSHRRNAKEGKEILIESIFRA